MGIGIKRVTWRNFMGYGDYDTCVDFSLVRGPTLVTGLIDDSENSNGAGKSTISVAILWGLFGKTFTSSRPGDNVVNFWTGENCYVKIETDDGWVITRTRKMQKHSDLLVYYEGCDETRSTNDEAQKFLEAKFNLDYDLFVSSVFFGQMGKSFLEMSDQKRKLTLERLLGLDRVNEWARVAKEKYQILDDKNSVNNDRVEYFKEELERLDEQLESNKSKHALFETQRAEQIKKCTDLLGELEDKINAYLVIKDEVESTKERYEKVMAARLKQREIENTLNPLKVKKGIKEELVENKTQRLIKLQDQLLELEKYDIEALRKDAARKKDLNDKIVKLTNTKSSINSDLKRIRGILAKWDSKVDTVCGECEQKVDIAHVELHKLEYYDKVNTLNDKLTSIDKELLEYEKEAKSLESSLSLRDIDNISSELSDTKASITKLASEIYEAESNIIEMGEKIDKYQVALDKLSVLDSVDIDINSVNNKIKEYEVNLAHKESNEKELSRLKGAENPYGDIIRSVESSIEDVDHSLGKIVSAYQSNKDMMNYYDYIYKAFSNRRKIKKMLLNSLIPYLNNRLSYYLDSFECDLKIEFTAGLGVSSNMWSYDYYSGGERRRADVALMFALYDLYSNMYGQQCNIMVLDEVDGRMDASGIESFKGIISNDFTENGDGRLKPDTILIISHRKEMVDAFPGVLKVYRDNNRLSYLV